MRNVAASVVLALTGAGCAATSSSGNASCAFLMVFHGRTYVGISTASPVTGEHPLGSVRRPTCFDTNHVTADERAAERAATRARHAAWTLPGIDPRMAFAIPSEFPRVVFYSRPGSSRLRDLPPALRRLVTR
jgi:hypothetical protein